MDADDGRDDAALRDPGGHPVRQDHPGRGGTGQPGGADHRARGGYLGVWAAAGLPAFGLAWLAGWLTGRHPGAAHIAAVAVFAVAGAYQLSRLKDRCLAKCRSPLGLLLHYGSYRGRFRDLRVGAHHGGYCLGCCWALMVILIAVGVMNVAAMVGLAALVLIEKTWTWGPAARSAGGHRRAGPRGGHDLVSLAGPGPACRARDDELIYFRGRAPGTRRQGAVGRYLPDRGVTAHDNARAATARVGGTPACLCASVPPEPRP